MTTDIIFETHSLTEDNEKGIATGWLPGRLSAEGRRLAAELGERRRDVDAVYVSDLGRAVETAEIAFAGTDVPIRPDVRLRECDYGELNGCPVAVLAAERSRHIDVPFPGGQSYRDVVEATAGFLRDLAEDDGRHVLMISHSANKWAFDHLLTGAALEDLVDAPSAGVRAGPTVSRRGPQEG